MYLDTSPMAYARRSTKCAWDSSARDAQASQLSTEVGIIRGRDVCRYRLRLYGESPPMGASGFPESCDTPGATRQGGRESPQLAPN